MSEYITPPEVLANQPKPAEKSPSRLREMWSNVKRFVLGPEMTTHQASRRKFLVDLGKLTVGGYAFLKTLDLPTIARAVSKETEKPRYMRVGELSDLKQERLQSKWKDLYRAASIEIQTVISRDQVANGRGYLAHLLHEMDENDNEPPMGVVTVDHIIAEGDEVHIFFPGAGESLEVESDEFEDRSWGEESAVIRTLKRSEMRRVDADINDFAPLLRVDPRKLPEFSTGSYVVTPNLFRDTDADWHIFQVTDLDDDTMTLKPLFYEIDTEELEKNKFKKNKSSYDKDEYELLGAVCQGDSGAPMIWAEVEVDDGEIKVRPITGLDSQGKIQKEAGYVVGEVIGTDKRKKDQNFKLQGATCAKELIVSRPD